MSPHLLVAVQQLRPDAKLPVYATDGAAGMDLYENALNAGAEYTLEPGDRVLVDTGIALSLPPGYEAQIRPRSGLALSHGVTVLNSPGTIDADYRGEIKVLLVNLGHDPFTIHRGDRIAQLVFAPVARASLQVMTTLPDSSRGVGGFGSTGTK